MDNRVRRIGVIAPPGNVAVEREFPLYLPRGVVLNHNRLSRPDSIQTPESILAMNDSLELVAVNLAQAYPEVITYACTGGSFLEGLGQEAQPAERIERATGIPGVTTSVAVVAALRALEARSVVLIAPYPHDIMAFEVKFLQHYGFTVTAWDTFNCLTSEANRALSSEQIAEKVLSHREAIAASDAVFVSCTNILVMDQIERLERELQRPVVTSNQATLWAVFNKMNLDSRGLHGGQLFEQHSPVARAAAAV
jgi:maleate isomerase